MCVQLLLVCSQIIQRLWTTLMLNSCAMTPCFNLITVSTFEHENVVRVNDGLWVGQDIQEFLRGVCIINIKYV